MRWVRVRLSLQVRLRMRVVAMRGRWWMGAYARHALMGMRRGRSGRIDRISKRVSRWRGR